MKTSRRFRFGHWVCLTLIVGLGFSLIYLTYAHVDAQNSWQSIDDATANAIASHYHGYNKKNKMWKNYQSARHSATLSAENHPIGHSVKGRYDIYAYCGGFSGQHGGLANSFTLTIKAKKILGITVGKKGDSHSQSRYDFLGSSTPKYAGAADAFSKCGKAQTRVVRT